MYSFKIVEKKDLETILEGAIVTDKNIVEIKTLRVVAVSRKDPTNIKYGAINYKIGSKKKAFQKIKQKLAVAFK